MLPIFSSLIIVNFDGNNIFNIICHDDTTGQMSLFDLQTSTTVDISQNVCMGYQLFTSGINGDKRYDLFCKKKGEKITYLLNDDDGAFKNGK